jgi:sugar phosphate isomerase/epimerase
VRLTAPDGSTLRLAYGMNVHAGGSADVLEAALASTVEPLRERLRAGGSFGLAVRLDRDGVDELTLDEERRRRVGELLAAAGLFAFTGNAFVVGAFHEAGTKASVYRPTWASEERARYTVAFARVLAAWAEAAGEDGPVSLSTAPLSFKPFAEPVGFLDAAAARIAGVARALGDVEDETGVAVRLAIEPEPLCTLETTEETIAFFDGPLARALRGDDAARRRVGVCYDVCHQAVEGEDPAAGLAALAAAGVAVEKVQASCALSLEDPADPAGRAALARYDEPRWLHQVVAGVGPSALRAADLPEALGTTTGTPSPRWLAARPWRVHCHVPVHRATLAPPLRTTQPALEAALRAVVRHGHCRHLEVETYAWAGLPAEVRAGGLVESLARELEWVLGVLESEGVRRADDEEEDA